MDLTDTPDPLLAPEMAWGALAAALVMLLVGGVLLARPTAADPWGNGQGSGLSDPFVSRR